MKFIHIADVHLGAQPEAGEAYSKERPRELWDTFSRVIDCCNEERAELLLIAGDLFHRQPLLRELKETAYLFSKLERTQVVMIAGNHDYIKKDSYYRTFVWPEHVHMLSKGTLEHIVLPGLDTAVYGLSYHSREITEPLYDNARAQRAARYEILLAHGGDERHIPIRRECLKQSGFDYIALGHIHRRQSLTEGFAEYAGSLEPTDKNDIGKHGYITGELDESGLRLRFVPIAGREYLHLALQVKETMTNGNICDWVRRIIEERGRQHLYRFILQGRRDVDVVFDTTRMDPFGNVLEVVDKTRPAYDFERLLAENKGNLIGRFIESFAGCAEDSVEYQALCEGVEALLSGGMAE